MGDFYTEQLVKRQKASSTTLIKAILIILTVLSVVLIFMIPFGIIGPVIMIALDVFLFRSMDVEYEYLFVYWILIRLWQNPVGKICFPWR